MNKQNHTYGGRHKDEAQRDRVHQMQIDEILGVGYVEPDVGYYCGMCQLQEKVAVLMSKENLIKHGKSEGLGHEVKESKIEGFLQMAIFAHRRVQAEGGDMEPATPTLDSTPNTLEPSNEIVQAYASPQETHKRTFSQYQESGTRTLAASANALPSEEENTQIRSSLRQKVLGNQAANVAISEAPDFIDRSGIGKDNENNGASSATGIHGIHRKFPAARPMATPRQLQRGSPRVNFPSASTATSQATARFQKPAGVIILPGKSREDQDEEEQDEHGMDGKKTGRYTTNNKKKNPNWPQVMMVGVWIEPQPSDKLTGMRSFESHCNTFKTEKFQPDKPWRGKKEYLRSLAYSSPPPSPSSSSGTQKSSALIFNPGFASAPSGRPASLASGPLARSATFDPKLALEDLAGSADFNSRSAGRQVARSASSISRLTSAALAEFAFSDSGSAFAPVARPANFDSRSTFASVARPVNFDSRSTFAPVARSAAFGPRMASIAVPQSGYFDPRLASPSRGQSSAFEPTLPSYPVAQFTPVNPRMAPASIAPSTNFNSRFTSGGYAQREDLGDELDSMFDFGERATFDD